MQAEILYEKSKIGRKIASGGDRRVFMYGDDKVIKISSLSFLVGKKLHQKLAKDHAIAKRYLQDFVLETSDVSPADGGNHIEIQPFIQGDRLKEMHMKDSRARLQLEEIRKIMGKMSEDGQPVLDLIGNYGVFSPCLSNIMIDVSGDLKIIDTTLFETKSVRPFGFFLDIFLPFIKARQNYLLEKFLR